MNSLEWGSVSDWVSTGSSIATAYIAYLAYKSVPNWINQKRFEAGFNHVTSLMSEYDIIENDIQKIYFKILTLRHAGGNSSETWNEVETIANRIILLQSNLLACQRWNIYALPETHRCFARLKNFCNLCYKLQGAVITSNDTAVVTIHRELELLKNIISGDSSNFKKNIHDYFQLPY
ncbi:hypothetical protein OR235_004578 [Enterobacter cloacae]|nr:hypothetical protein [Enterobacter cloacae]